MLLLLVNIAVVWLIDVGRNLFLKRGRIYAQP